MAYNLTFDKLIDYDTGVPGISIGLELRLKESAITRSAKIDTGADGCIFARECGEQLGLEIESGEKQIFATATGSFIAYSHMVTLVTADFSFDSTVYFAHDEGFNKNILGRFGWLDRVVIGINDYDGKLYLSRYE